MVNIREAIIDQYKYAIRCSRCGKCFFSIMEILDIIPAICSECHIGMPVKFLGNARLVASNCHCYTVDK